MKIYIEDNARMKMRKTAKYIHKHFGSKARLKFRNSIDNIIVLLRQNPKLGAQEQLHIHALVGNGILEFHEGVGQRLPRVLEGDCGHVRGENNAVNSHLGLGAQHLQ